MWETTLVSETGEPAWHVEEIRESFLEGGHLPWALGLDLTPYGTGKSISGSRNHMANK